ncbi:hypothetical protein AABB24_029361 [Solanum stoloniferum]|uniref:Uncharacterized protein n=1 Tax=Solanum stoloniferum TaxID=62892 RepID=A0ABD2RYN6_9SOLN
MNYKAFTLILFVLIFCLSSTMASRRILSGPGNSKMPTQPHRPKPGPSATIQPPPVKRGGSNYISYRALKRPQICNEKEYGKCISSPAAVRRCNLGERCKSTLP